jgi:hypothetical protein
LAPGTTLSLKDESSGGGIAGSYDATRLFGLSANQGLILSGFFGYQRDSFSFGTNVAGLGNAGSLQKDTYTLGGSFLNNIDTTYLNATAALDFGHGNETQNVDGSTGSFNTHGYATDLRIGKVFTLLNTISAGNPVMPTKARPGRPGATPWPSM